MKSIIALSAITALTALALVGCNQNNSTETPSSNSRMSDTNSMMGGTTNMMATNSMPNMDMPATNKTTGAANDATR
jgi:ABC-type Fe3+-hydroxamate transport system substrate-binding protein